jgi:hypothetical protein
MAVDYTPRRGNDPDPVNALRNELAALRRDIAEMQKSNNLNNASVSGVGNRITAYDASGAPMAHFGALDSVPGAYGIEIYSGGAWVRVQPGL